MEFSFDFKSKSWIQWFILISLIHEAKMKLDESGKSWLDFFLLFATFYVLLVIPIKNSAVFFFIFS